MPYIGARIKRKEDVRLLRGIGKYVGDIHRPGMVHAAILRSTHAHARIVKIDTARRSSYRASSACSRPPTCRD